jgi:hypothetical protein
MNWGWKITILYIFFAAGILTLVFLSINQKIDLVDKNYYEKELVHQSRLDQQANYASLDKKCSFQFENGKAVVLFPFTLNEMKDATVKVYCPSNNAFDASYNLTASADSAFAFSLPTGIPSRYNIEVFWKKDGKEYYFEEIIGHKHVH